MSMSLDYQLLRATMANIGAALVVTAVVRMVIFDESTMEAIYLLLGGFYMVIFALIRRNQQ